MNKYSSKAIKTAATVGMSLAMVLSNAAPVLADTANTNMSVCTGAVTQEQMGALNLFRSNNKDWEKAKLTTTFEAQKVTKGGTRYDVDGNLINETDENEETVAKATNGDSYAQNKTFNIDGKEESFVLVFNDAQATSDKTSTSDDDTYYYVTSVASPKFFVTATSKVDVNMIGYMAGNISNTVGSKSNATAIDDIIVTTGSSSEFNKALNDIDTNCYDSGENALKVNANAMLKLIAAVTTTDKTELVNLAKGDADNDADIVENVQKFLDKYKGNLTAQQRLYLEEAIVENTTDTSANEYQTGLSKFLDEITGEWEDILTSANVTKLVNGSAITNVEIEEFIDETVKKAPNYTKYKKDEAVIDFIAEVEATKDDVKAVMEAVSKIKNDSYKEYTKGTTSVASKVKDNLKLDKGSVSVIEGKTFTSADYAILKAFKEDVVDVVMTMESKEVGSRYLDKSTKSPYATSAQVKTVLSDFHGLEGLADSETGNFYWDVLAKHMEKVTTALKAVTTDIEKLTPANIKATDKATLIAAEDALYELQKGDYSQNLTKDEAKEVRSAETKIANLRTAFDNLGTTNVAGWYDMGNGNWGYNNEDGTPAAYKWVASGADWYMIKDGKMLRNTWLATDGGRWYYLDNAGKMVTNQSVDGCWINSYGVYVSPTYKG